MSDEKQETTVDILREMRNLGKLDEKSIDEVPRTLLGLGMRTYADRLEVACKREVDKLNSAIQATVGRSDAEIDRLRRKIEELKRAGNMAKLRRVCEQMLELLKAPPGFNGCGMSVELDEEQVVMWRNRFLDALAAPPRNCDVGTAEEQAQRFYNFCTEHSSAIHGMCDYKCPCIDSGDKCHCLCKWAQMPYEEGGAK